MRNEAGWYRLEKRSVTPELRSTYEREQTELVAALRNRDPELARELARKRMLRVRGALLPLL